MEPRPWWTLSLRSTAWAMPAPSHHFNLIVVVTEVRWPQEVTFWAAYRVWKHEMQRKLCFYFYITTNVAARLRIALGCVHQIFRVPSPSAVPCGGTKSAGYQCSRELALWVAWTMVQLFVKQTNESERAYGTCLRAHNGKRRQECKSGQRCLLLPFTVNPST